jgi:hypothetical protein
MWTRSATSASDSGATWTTAAAASECVDGWK